MTPLLLCLTENSPKFYRLACQSITKLVTRGFFDPPGVGFVPSDHVISSPLLFTNHMNNDDDANSIREIRDEISKLPTIDFVLGFLCECFPPTIDPPTSRKSPSKHFVIRDFHETLIKAFERDEARYLRVETVFRALWGLFRSIEFLVCEAKASNSMMIRASEDGRSPHIMNMFKEKTNQIRKLIRESQNCMNRIADSIMLRFINSVRTYSKFGFNPNPIQITREPIKRNITTISNTGTPDVKMNSTRTTRESIVRSVLSNLTSRACEGSMIEMLLARLKRQGPIFGPSSREWCGIVSNAANEISSHVETRHVIVLLITLSRVAMEALQKDSESNFSSSVRLANLKNASFSSPLRNGNASPVTSLGGGHHFGRNGGGSSSSSSGSTTFNSTDFSKSANVGNETAEDASQRNPSILSSESKELTLKILIRVLSQHSTKISSCFSCLQIVRRLVCTSVLHNLVDIQHEFVSVFRSNLDLIKCLWNHYRRHLKVEFSEIWAHGLHPLLQYVISKTHWFESSIHTQ